MAVDTVHDGIWEAKMCIYTQFDVELWTWKESSQSCLLARQGSTYLQRRTVIWTVWLELVV